MELPRFLVFKSLMNNKYLCKGPVVVFAPNFNGVEALNMDLKHEVEMARCGGGCVHIRCCKSGKYLRRFDRANPYIYDLSDGPDEDKSKLECTLFKPVPYTTKEGVDVVLLQHFQNGKSTFVTHHPNGYALAGDQVQASGADLHLTVVDWISFLTKLVRDCDDSVTVTISSSIEETKMRTLPRFVLFQSTRNGKYLRCKEEVPCLLKFMEKDVVSAYSKHEVVMAKRGGGLVHIKCCATGKYWRRKSEDDHRIVAEADEPEEDLTKWSCTLFWPCYDTKEDDNAVQLYHSQLGESVSLFQECLASTKSPNTENVCMIACNWELLAPKPLPSPSVDPKKLEPNKGGMSNINTGQNETTDNIGIINSPFEVDGNNNINFSVGETKTPTNKDDQNDGCGQGSPGPPLRPNNGGMSNINTGRSRTTNNTGIANSPLNIKGDNKIEFSMGGKK